MDKSRANPININELKAMITRNPGTKSESIKSRFQCNSSKMYRALNKLTAEGFLFSQAHARTNLYFDSVYAKANKLAKRVRIAPRPNEYYRKKRLAKESGRELKGMSQLEQILWLNKIWPVSGVSR